MEVSWTNADRPLGEISAIDVDISFLPVSSTSAKFPHKKTWSMKDFGGFWPAYDENGVLQATNAFVIYTAKILN